ncbi:hypothetical protein ACFOUP_06420 [Belliella kenyensis]|uniref:Uncharacterized protein n=1 Tax=Belliella kenyensis TaxID=1472724 RepID=A0ABV8EI82_9BACT|nr:hypothetical protein [Belliella kenyensis]MCH7401303.1 hypothetical protein [Belliella kenyensis]MDN3602748.1 hypothetical protein [Belliella kenyensis]
MEFRQSLSTISPVRTSDILASGFNPGVEMRSERLEVRDEKRETRDKRQETREKMEFRQSLSTISPVRTSDILASGFNPRGRDEKREMRSERQETRYKIQERKWNLGNLCRLKVL